jgi:hypothetical protein
MTTSRVLQGTKPGTIIIEIEIAQPEFWKLSAKAERHGTKVADLILAAYEKIAPNAGRAGRPAGATGLSRAARTAAIRKLITDGATVSAVVATFGITAAAVLYHRNAIRKSGISS